MPLTGGLQRHDVDWPRHLRAARVSPRPGDPGDRAWSV